MQNYDLFDTITSLDVFLIAYTMYIVIKVTHE